MCHRIQPPSTFHCEASAPRDDAVLIVNFTKYKDASEGHIRFNMV